MPSLSDQVRALLAETDHPAVRIAEAANVHQVNLSQFRSGKRDLPLKNLEAIADFLGYRVVLEKKTTRIRPKLI